MGERVAWVTGLMYTSSHMQTCSLTVSTLTGSKPGYEIPILGKQPENFSTIGAFSQLLSLEQGLYTTIWERG